MKQHGSRTTLILFVYDKGKLEIKEMDTESCESTPTTTTTTLTIITQQFKRSDN